MAHRAAHEGRLESLQSSGFLEASRTTEIPVTNIPDGSYNLVQEPTITSHPESVANDSRNRTKKQKFNILQLPVEEKRGQKHHGYRQWFSSFGDRESTQDDLRNSQKLG